MAKKVAKKKSVKKSGHKIALAVLSSIVLTILLVSLTNVGLSIFLEAPEYNDYCKGIKTQEAITTQVRCEEVGGEWNPEGKTYPVAPEDSRVYDGYCDVYYECQGEYDAAREDYNQIKYYVFAGIGFLLLLLGVFSAMHTLQYTGLATGAILLTEGIVTNFENKVTVFISLLLILIVFGLLVWKKIEER